MKNEKQCLTSDLISLGFENVYWLLRIPTFSKLTEAFTEKEKLKIPRRKFKQKFTPKLKHQQKLFLIYLTKLRFVLKIDKKSSLVLFKCKIKIKE